MSLDYVRAYNVRTKMQADLDTALLAAVKSEGTKNTKAVQKAVETWFAAQTDQSGRGYEISDIAIGAVDQDLTATAKVAVPTTLLQIIDVEAVDVSVKSSVAGPKNEFVDVYIVLDKSASMMLAATKDGQLKMMSSPAGCAFACHVVEGGPYNYNGKTYNTNYDLARGMDVELRTDVAMKAVYQVLLKAYEINTTSPRIRIGLYTVGKTGKQIIQPTYSLLSVYKKTTSDSAGFNGATSEDASFFDYSLDDLTKLVGNGGDGSVTSPRKLVLLLTDGLQSERNWVHDTSNGIRFPTTVGKLTTATTPLNPAWCTPIKENKVSFGVLYTEYLPLKGDWGYDRTAGATMGTSGYKSIWNATFDPSYKNVPRQEYIPVSLKDCASGTDLFIHADSSEEIEEGLTQLFEQYLSKIRLIN